MWKRVTGNKATEIKLEKKPQGVIMREGFKWQKGLNMERFGGGISRNRSREGPGSMRGDSEKRNSMRGSRHGGYIRGLGRAKEGPASDPRQGAN